MSQIFGVGVVQSIDVEGGRITIAYEPIEGVNWPAGTMPFVVAKSALLEAVTPGDRVRFRLEGQQIAELKPLSPRESQTGAPLVPPRDRAVTASGRDPRP